jgi:transcriptional/translational regulatory protein YebC/TACO1
MLLFFFHFLLHFYSKEKTDLIVTDVDQQNLLHEIVEELKIPGTMSLAYIPKEVVEVEDPNHYDSNITLIESLESLDDVDTVFHNMKL